MGKAIVCINCASIVGNSKDGSNDYRKFVCVDIEPLEIEESIFRCKRCGSIISEFIVSGDEVLGLRQVDDGCGDSL